MSGSMSWCVYHVYIRSHRKSLTIHQDVVDGKRRIGAAAAFNESEIDEPRNHTRRYGRPGILGLTLSHQSDVARVRIGSGAGANDDLCSAARVVYVSMSQNQMTNLAGILAGLLHRCEYCVRSVRPSGVDEDQPIGPPEQIGIDGSKLQSPEIARDLKSVRRQCGNLQPAIWTF